MFSGHIAIQYMFCMFFMIKKIIFEGFNDRGGANVRGRRGTTSKGQKITKQSSTNHKKQRCMLAFSRRILDESPPYFACRDFFTCAIDLEGSQGLGSLKMKV